MYIPLYDESINNGKYGDQFEDYCVEENTAKECLGIQLFNSDRQTLLFQPNEVLYVSYDYRPLLVWELVGVTGAYMIVRVRVRCYWSIKCFSTIYASWFLRWSKIAKRPDLKIEMNKCMSSCISPVMIINLLLI